jgi:cobalt-zinc-cadmium resistance protein CzcA
MIDKTINFVLRNQLMMLVIGAIVIGYGYYSYTRLPVDAFPDVSPNLVQVFTITEGLAPEEIEKYVTYPVEASMNGLPGIVNTRSVSNFGLSVVSIYFEDGLDIYFVRRLVDERLQEAREQIPEGFGVPVMGPIATGMGLVLFYYLDDESGKRSLEELRSIQDWLVKFQLQTIPGVTEVLGIGGYEKQYHVVVHPDNLLRYDISLGDIIEKIKANNLNVGAQFIEKNSEEFVVRSVGLASTIADLEEIIIISEDGTPVFLKQIADISIGGAIRRGLQTRDGVGEIVAGMVIKLFGTNSSTVIGAVEERVNQINKTLPEGVKIVPYYEQKTIVEACVNTIRKALVEGILLVGVIIIAFLGAFRPTLVVALAIPFSVLFATIWMKQFNISANLMSLGGLAIAIGMLVDGAIVMAENVDRMLRQSDPDEPRIHVVARACAEVSRPIIFSILIIAIVFLPLFTLQGVEGKTFRPLAFTVALAMLGSLVFAIFLAPALSFLFMRRPKRANVESEHSDHGLIRWLLIPYRPVVLFFVKRRHLAVIFSLIVLLLGVLVYPRLGSEFTPTLQEGTILVRLTMAPSISIEESARTVTAIEKRLMKMPAIRSIVTRVGRGEVGAHSEPVNNAEMILLLKPQENWGIVQTQEELQDSLRERLETVPGVMASLSQPIQATVDELVEGVRAELAIKVFGEDLDILKQKADEIAGVISKVKGASDVQPDQIGGAPQLLIKINRQSIARYGINVSDVQGVISAAVGGEKAGQIFEGVRRFDILVRFPTEHRDTPEAIGQILVKTPTGSWVPLRELAAIEEIVGPRQITRENNQRFITIQCNVTGRDIGSFVLEAQKAIEDQVKLPAGYLTTWGGQYKLQQEANKRFAVVIPITLFFVLLLLYSSFNSIKNTLLILLNIPLALVGGVVALWITKQNLSVPASVGFIALFGIALQNGIVLVTYINQLVRDGLSVEEASIRGASLRLRPVLMTACCAALGLIPLVFSHGIGSEVERPLATVVVGGLVTSTFLTLLVIPAIYKWFAASVD